MPRSNAELRADRALLNIEADRRLNETARRGDSAIARATVVVGAAVIVAGLQIAGWNGWLHVIVLALSFAAAVLAVVVLAFRPGKEMPVGSFQSNIDAYEPSVLAKHILQLKVSMIALDEARIGRQARLLLASIAKV
jgi:hypothetical protein